MRRHKSVDSFAETGIARSGGDARPVLRRTVPLFLTAAFLAVTWTPLRANDLGQSTDTSAQTSQKETDDPPASPAADGPDHQKTETLARELAFTRSEIEALLNQLNKQRGEAAIVKQAADSE